MGRPRKYREVVRILRKHDSRFELWEDRGKGTELRKGIISAIIRRFNLPDGLL